jgi:predicted transcriptional regulator
MLAPCEVVVRCALPSIRALIAEELVNKHNLNQAEAAKLLGVSQPAISLYCRKIRGKAINLENNLEIKKLIEKLAEQLTKDKLSRKEFIPKLCEICRMVRAKGLLCETHKLFEPSIGIDGCDLCLTTDLPACL